MFKVDTDNGALFKDHLLGKRGVKGVDIQLPPL